MLYTKNKEGYSDYSIDKNAWINRKHGLSAVVRLANEDEFIKPCIESIIDWHDEIICALNVSTDRTEYILRSFNSPKIKIYQYPFKLMPNGHGYEDQPASSVYSKTYFYNWALSLSNYEWVSQWDGDMVAHDWLGDKVRKLIDSNKYDHIFLQGVNVVRDLKHMSNRQPVIKENQPRFVKMAPAVHYINGQYTQKLQGLGKRFYKDNISDYLHFKWAKRKEDQHKVWPENWEKIPQFQKLELRANPGNKYDGPIPILQAAHK